MRRTIGILSIVLLFVACATEPPSILKGATDESFEKWVARNAPKATKTDEGLYVEYVERGTTNPDLKVRMDSSWLEIGYTGRMFDGTIFTTRTEQVARHLGTWENTTHWVDDYSNITQFTNLFCPGFRRALLDMHEGDSVRAYISAANGYGEIEPFNSGYIGETADYLYSPIIMDIRLKRIIDKPEEHELNMVQDYAMKKWGLEKNDTIIEGAYWRRTTVVPGGDTVAHNGLVDIDKSDFFLDGFILGTTVDSIAKVYGIYDSEETYSSMSISVDDNSSNKLIRTVLLKMLHGEEAEIVCTSQWTIDGTAGNVANLPQINPYTPRLYKIKLLIPEKDDEEEDKTDK